MSRLFGRWLSSVCTALILGCGSGGGGGASDGDARTLLVRWRQSPEVAGYVIHWGMSSGVYTEALDVGAPESDADSVVSIEIEIDDAGATVYLALTSYDDQGRMSGFSNELSALLP